MNQKIKKKNVGKCHYWLCSQPAEQLCYEIRFGEMISGENWANYFCREHCRRKNSGCQNNHPQPKPLVSSTPNWSYSPPDISQLSKKKLKKEIEKDWRLINELKQEIENDFAALEVEDQEECWDSSLVDDLLTDLEKTRLVIESENGLKAKLELWESWQEATEEQEFSED